MKIRERNAAGGGLTEFKGPVTGKTLADLRSREEGMCLCGSLLPCLLKSRTIHPAHSYY